MKQRENHYPIRVVARKTGLSPFVIRAWENRYGAVEPGRSETNRRLYSDADVRRFALLGRLTRQGHRIGQVARLSDEALEGLLGQAPAWNPAPAVRDGAASAVVEDCLAAVARLDRQGLDQALAQAQVVLSTPRLLDEVVAPLLTLAGERWRGGAWRIAHEHVATAALTGLLQQMHAAAAARADGPAIVLSTPAGQRHGVGALMASVVAAEEGWRDVYLGPDMPARELAHVVRETTARALALSIIHPLDDPHLPGELERLRQYLPPGFPVFVGGAGAAAYHAVLERIDAVRLSSLAAFREELLALRRQPPVCTA